MNNAQNVVVGSWVKTVLPTRMRDKINGGMRMKVPTGIVGKVFWIGSDHFGNVNCGIQIGEEHGQSEFVGLSKVEEVNPAFLREGLTDTEVEGLVQTCVALSHAVTDVNIRHLAKMASLSKV